MLVVFLRFVLKKMHYSVDIYDKKGTVVSTVALNEELFADNMVNESLIHEYYLLQTANARNPIACVKGRGAVNGSGKKIFKQKGTGNARAGDKNSPIRRGGGVAFGPRGEASFEKAMTRKARKIALYGLLSLKAKDSSLCGLQNLDFSAPKTSEALSVLENIKLSNKKVLLVLSQKDEIIQKSFRNIKGVKYVLVNYLNPVDIMHADKIVFMESALQVVNQK